MATYAVPVGVWCARQAGLYWRYTYLRDSEETLRSYGRMWEKEFRGQHHASFRWPKHILLESS